jgi:hypothetical protein
MTKKPIPITTSDWLHYFNSKISLKSNILLSARVSKQSKLMIFVSVSTICVVGISTIITAADFSAYLKMFAIFSIITVFIIYILYLEYKYHKEYEKLFYKVIFECNNIDKIMMKIINNELNTPEEIRQEYNNLLSEINKYIL